MVWLNENPQVLPFPKPLVCTAQISVTLLSNPLSVHISVLPVAGRGLPFTYRSLDVCLGSEQEHLATDLGLLSSAKAILKITRLDWRSGCHHNLCECITSGQSCSRHGYTRSNAKLWAETSKKQVVQWAYQKGQSPSLLRGVAKGKGLHKSMMRQLVASAST